MKRILFVSLVVALSCIGFTDAKASYYFTFTDTTGAYSLTGTLLTPSNGPGPYTVMAGSSATGTGTSNLGVLYSYVYTPGYATFNQPGGGTASYDGQLSPGSNPVLTYNGLLFQPGDSSTYLNIYGSGVNAYEYFALLPSSTVSGTLTLAPVPIPGAVWLLGSGLLGLVGIGRKRLQK